MNRLPQRHHTVEDGHAEATRYVKIDIRDGMLFFVLKRSAANTVEVSRKVRAEMERLKTRLPADVKIDLVLDTADYIVDSLNNLSGTLITGSILVVLVTFLFLGSVRQSLIIAVTIPFSLIITFIILYALGYTINWFSLLSLGIAAGMVVDNAIVVLENIRSPSSGAASRESHLLSAPPRSASPSAPRPTRRSSSSCR